jgi:hypothetical protein
MTADRILNLIKELQERNVNGLDYKLFLEQQIHTSIRSLVAERDALRSKVKEHEALRAGDGALITELKTGLETLRNQEPFGWIMAESLDDFKRGNIVEVSRGRETSDDVALYLAAGAKEKQG